MIKIKNDLKRDSNFELLRIITMLLIISHHYVVNSGLMEKINENMFSDKSLFLLIIGAWGKTGINIFLLITGYFMCQSSISIDKFFKLIFEVIFYKVIIWIIFSLTGYESFSIMAVIETICPVTSISLNFTDCYLVFFLCIPFLNILIKNMNEKQHIHLILLCFFVYIFLGTTPKIEVVMNYVTWYIVIYFIAAYIRIYSKPFFENKRLWRNIALISILISIASIFAGAYIGNKINKPIFYYLLSDSNKILAVTTAISVFLYFKNLHIKKSKLINIVAASTFGVLQIHANSDAMRQWLWKDLLQTVEMYNSKWLILHVLGSVVGVYLVCTAIDYIRIRIVERPIMNLWKKYNKRDSEK